MWRYLFSFPRWMYWTDWEEDPTESNRGKIKKAWMDGSHHQVFLTSKTVLWPNGLSLDIPQGILYWVDAYYDRIELVYLNTTERKVGVALRIHCIYCVIMVYMVDYGDTKDNGYRKKHYKILILPNTKKSKMCHFWKHDIQENIWENKTSFGKRWQHSNLTTEHDSSV